jgi:OmpA-OmpF porin, OOP family
MKKMMLAAALTAACGVAAAQGYAGALIGMSKFDCSGLCSKDTDTAYKIYGGFDMSPDLAIEVGYANFGKVKLNANGATGEGKASVLSVVAAMRFPFTKDFAGVGRLGLGYVNSKASASAPGQSALAESKGVNLYAGLGLEYAVASDFKIVSQFDLADNGDIYLFGLGAQLAY